MTAIRDALRAIIDTLDAEEMGEGPPASEHVAHWQKLHDDGSAALAALDAETPVTPADVGEEPVAWRYRGEFAGKKLPWQTTDAEWLAKREAENGDEVEPLYSATALERVVRERDAAENGKEYVRKVWKERAESAEAKLAEARKVIEPFSDMGGEMFARGWDSTNVALALDNPNDPHRVTAGDFFAARRFLEETK